MVLGDSCILVDKGHLVYFNDVEVVYFGSEISNGLLKSFLVLSCYQLFVSLDYVFFSRNVVVGIDWLKGEAVFLEDEVTVQLVVFEQVDALHLEQVVLVVEVRRKVCRVSLLG